MSRFTRRMVAIGSTIALVALSTVVTATPAYAACNSADGVYVSAYGITISGTVWWSGQKSGSYSVYMSNNADGYQARMMVDFFKHDIGWIDRFQWNQADGVTNGIASDIFAKSYQIDKIRLGVVYAGGRVYELYFDVNDRCGA